MLENQAAASISLDGSWQIRINDQDGTLQVPGVWEVQGYPRDITTATLSRRVEIPANWENSRVMLQVGAASYDVTFFINGERVGQHKGMWSPFEFDVSHALNFGGENTITCELIKPCNEDEGEYSYRDVLVGFVPYVSSTFGGIWQSLSLIAHSTPAWENVHILADAITSTITVKANLADAPPETPVQLFLYDDNRNLISGSQTILSEINRPISVSDIKYWSPDSPYLYTIELRAGDTVTTRRFGFRRLRAEGHDLYLNEKPIFLRGILSWGWNPETLAPIFSDEFIRDEFARVREAGFNLYKLCLYIPPENLLRIADEEGMLLWLELPMWYQRDNPHLREQLPLEYAEIMNRLHHHPSIVLISLGCEIGSDMVQEGLVSTLATIVQKQTQGVLICENSGSGEAYGGHTPDIADFYDYHFYSEAYYFQPLLQHFRRDWRTPRPWIFGEFNAMDDYRNPAPGFNADGSRAWWRDLLGVSGGIHRWAYCEQEDRIKALALPYSDEEMVAQSRKQSFALRKLILEATRASDLSAGYVITGLRDTPITTSGLWDDTLTLKYESTELRQINEANVLLLEQGRRRIWIEGDRPAPLDKFNHRAGTHADFQILFSGTIFNATTVRWSLTNEQNAVIAAGEESVISPPLDAKPRQIARISWQWPQVDSPICCNLNVASGDTSNSWSLWVYPQDDDWQKIVSIYDPAGTLHALNNLPHASFKDHSSVVIASVLTDELHSHIESGAQAVLLQAGDGIIPAKQIGFWQESLHLFYEHTIWSQMGKPEAVTGQFYGIGSGYAFDPTQTNYTPIMRRLHTRLFTATDMLIEMKIGSGRLIATTLNLLGGEGDQPTGLTDNVFGAYLLSQMVQALA